MMGCLIHDIRNLFLFFICSRFMVCTSPWYVPIYLDGFELVSWDPKLTYLIVVVTDGISICVAVQLGNIHTIYILNELLARL
jgi:hypothetical protein